MCVRTCACTSVHVHATLLIWMAEDNFRELILSFYHMGTRDWTCDQVWQHLYLGSHLFGSTIINVTSVVQDVLLCTRKERNSSRSFSYQKTVRSHHTRWQLPLSSFNHFSLDDVADVWHVLLNAQTIGYRSIRGWVHTWFCWQELEAPGNAISTYGMFKVFLFKTFSNQLASLLRCLVVYCIFSCLFAFSVLTLVCMARGQPGVFLWPSILFVLRQDLFTKSGARRLVNSRHTPMPASLELGWQVCTAILDFCGWVFEMPWRWSSGTGCYLDDKLCSVAMVALYESQLNLL